MVAVFSGSVDGASATIIAGTVFEVAEYVSCRWIIPPGRGYLARITACWVIISAVVDLTRLWRVVLPPIGSDQTSSSRSIVAEYVGNPG